MHESGLKRDGVVLEKKAGFRFDIVFFGLLALIIIINILGSDRRKLEFKPESIGVIAPIAENTIIEKVEFAKTVESKRSEN